MVMLVDDVGLRAAMTINTIPMTRSSQMLLVRTSP